MFAGCIDTEVGADEGGCSAYHVVKACHIVGASSGIFSDSTYVLDTH
jgi:hypothetical protein